jgi:tetratricopeptide (TPR) repeat protein
MKTMKTVTRITMAALALALFMLPVGLVQAQISDRANLERELERTEELIQKAAELARDAGNAQALELIGQAMEIQQQARKGFGNGNYDAARVRTQAARTIVTKVMALLLNPQDRADRVQQELQRTDDMLAKARDHLGPGGPESARTLLEAAHRQQQQAWELFRGGSQRPALRMTYQVRKVLNKARLQTEEFDPDKLEAQFKRVEELVRQATEAAATSGNVRAGQLAERAQELLIRAREFVANRQYLAAKHHLNQAGKFAQQSLRLSRSGDSPGSFERMANQYEERLARMTDLLAGAPNEAVANLLTESQEHYRLAIELNQAGPESAQRAFAELHLAVRLLERAKELLG